MSEPENPLRGSITRRRLLQGTALAGFGAFLAACSSSAATSAPASAAGASPTPAPTPSPTPVPTPKVLGTILNFANWPAYIDVSTSGADKGKSPTLVQFEQKTGVHVNYQEKIDDNDTFVATIQPQLKAGLDTGWDLMVLTDWMAARLIANGWIDTIDHDNVPNCVANLRTELRNYPWDPNNDHHYTWQSGMTGIGYNKPSVAKAGMKPLTKLAEFWDNRLANHVTFLTEMRDTFGLGLLKLGKDPAKNTIDDINAVVNDMMPLVQNNGLRFTGNSYLQDFANGKVWAAMVWSGDLASSSDPSNVFVFPAEGGMIWSDNMLIPKGAQHKYAAETFMNFVYDPKIAAQIEDYVYYVCPVQGAAAEIQKIDPSAATNPLIFPTDAMKAASHAFEALSDSDSQAYNDAFKQLTGG